MNVSFSPPFFYFFLMSDYFDLILRWNFFSFLVTQINESLLYGVFSNNAMVKDKEVLQDLGAVCNR